MLVDPIAKHDLPSFMDAFFGYNQILMRLDNQEKTSFITEIRLFLLQSYCIQPQNAGATYQHLVNKMFQDLLIKIMEVCIDNMLVKSLRAESHINHLK